MRRYGCWMLGLSLAAGMALRAPAQEHLDELAKIGEEHEKAGNYAEALKVYEKIMESPTYVNILAIKFNLGWAYYLTGAFDKAIPLFQDLSGARAPSEAIKQQALFLLADCHARLAATLPDTAPERKANLEKAIALQSEFQSKYPKNANVPQSMYGRGYAYFLNRQYAEAERDLKDLIRLFPANPAAQDGRFLLASVFSEQGLERIKAGRKDEATTFLDNARDLFRDLAKTEGNLVTANDSALALAETWFGAGLFHESIAAFQNVRSKTEAVRSLRARLDEAQTRLNTLIGRQEDTTAARGDVDRLRAQLRTVLEGPDLMVSAYLRIAQAYYELQWHDVARVVCRHLIPFAADAPKQQASFLLINTYLAEQDPDPAAEAFDEFQQTFGTDVPEADRISVVIGQLFMRRGLEGDIEQALEQFTKSAQEYPKGAAYEEALFLKFSTEYILERYPEVVATADQYLQAFPAGHYAPNALYYKAMGLAAGKQYEAALTNLNLVIEKYPKKTEYFEAVDEVAYQKGAVLAQMGRATEAVPQLNGFLERFPDSTLRPAAMYQLGIALHAAGQPDKAETVLREAARKFPNSDIAPIALYQVAVMHYEKKDWPRMAAALETLLDEFPASSQRTDAYFWLGFIARQDNRYEDAIDAFTRCVEADPAYAQAPECLLSIALCHQDIAEKMGLPTVLSEDRRRLYRAALRDAAYAFEAVLTHYPDSDQAQEAIPGMAKALYTLVRTRQATEADAERFFAEADARHADAPAIQAQLSFGLGNFLMQAQHTDKALAVFKQALERAPDVRLSPQLLASYAEALKDAGSLADAEAIYTRITTEFKDDPRALAPAWFGLADIKFRENTKPADEQAKSLFKKVLDEFPWYEQGKQGKVKLATIDERNGNYAEAEKSFEAVWRQEKGTARIAAMLGVARCQLAQIRDKQTRPANWHDLARVASENLTKIIVLYEAFPEYVSEAYWLLGQVCETKGEVDKAKEQYHRAATELAAYPAAKLAAARLQELGGYTPPAVPAAPAAKP